MQYICSKCNRPLTRQNNWHYCKEVSVDSLFTGKPAELIAVFDALLSEVNTWPGVSASATKTCVVFIALKTFLVVKVMKRELDLKFMLPAVSNDFPIYKHAAYGNKLEHYIRLSSPGDLDGDVLRFIKQSYILASATKI
jgi:hypothetical protein